MGILSRFTEPPKPLPPSYRCRTLVLMLCGLALMIFCSLTATRTPTDRFDLDEGVVLVLAFLFYFVAYQFAWPTRVTVILRVLASICVVFSLFYAFYTPTPTSRSDPYRGVVVILAFLLHFLANRFAWPKRVTVILRVLAWICTVFAVFYIFYLSRVLYPLPPVPLDR